MKKLMILLMGIAIILTGCSRDSLPVARLTKDYGHFYADEATPYKITAEEDLKIDYQCYNKVDESLTLGAFLFVDGIPQKFHTDDRKDAYMQPVFLNGNDTQLLSVALKPTLPEKADGFELTMATIDEPFYVAKTDNKSGYKGVFSVLGKTPLYINDCPIAEIKGYKTSDTLQSMRMSPSDFTVLGLENYREKPGNLPIIARLLNSDTNDDTPNFMLEYDNQGDIQVEFVFLNSTASATYRVSFFVDQTPIHVNGGLDFIDIEPTKGEIIWETISIDQSALKDNGVLYAFCVPINTASYKNFVAVKATNPMTLHFNN